jgi:hypothetical protein
VRLELHIDTESSAFDGGDEDEFPAQQELGRILGKAAHEIALHGYNLNEPNRLRDVNGNRCGYWIFTDEPLS